ncbi:MAG: ImmA/IrrE family metallo-endopeptidase [Spirochaetales bacterium]
MTKFQLKPITSATEHEAALAQFDSLIDADEGTPEAYERDVLAILIEKYEDETINLPLPHPIEAIKFRLEQAGLTRKALEPILGGKTRVSEILSGKRELTIQMARGLHAQLGIPAESLLGSSTPREGQTVDITWDRFPVVEMERNGAFRRFGLADVKGKAETAVGRLITFLGGVEALPTALFRTGASTRKNAKLNSYALRGWCLQVLAEAQETAVPRFDATKFTPEILRHLVQLSSQKDGPQAAQLFLGSLGVVLVHVKHLKNTYLDGAAFLTKEHKAVIGLSLRYNRIDNFWFALFHELGHLMMHLGDKPGDFLVDDLSLSAGSDDLVEKQADDFAQKALLPDDFALDQQDFITALDVVQYAQQQGISPAIVAGRVQHTKQNYRVFASLLGRGQVVLS